MKKVYSKNGDYTIKFAVDDINRVQEFISSENLSNLKIVDDKIFGKAYEIPCKVIS